MASASPHMMMKPQIILLKEGTDTSQGKGQLLSNINACLAVVDTVRTTLGPRGMDKLIVDEKGHATISNDGATIMKLLDIVHPAAKSLVDVARAQDAEVGDGTTSVVLLAGELLHEVKGFIEDGMAPRIIIQGYRLACQQAIEKVRQAAVTLKRTDMGELRSLLEKCAQTAMNSKIIHSQKNFFTKLVVDALLTLDEDDLNEKLIAMKKIPGGALQDSVLVDGVAFKKTFSYAGFEQQPKQFINPKILALNVELELKAERDNAEIRIDKIAEYQAVVDAEWSLFYDKLSAIVATNAQVVLSRLPIGDLATQYFADRGIFCAGRVPAADLSRVVQAVGGAVQSSLSDLRGDTFLGTCALFEERQVGSERYNIFSGCPRAKTCTFLIRGGSEQLLGEVERSLHDALMIAKRAFQSQAVIAGGGAIEMILSKHLRDFSKTIPGKQQLVVQAFARSLEIIPRQLCRNAGLDAIQVLNELRRVHSNPGLGARGIPSDSPCWMGVDVTGEFPSGIADNMARFVWEPAFMKTNLLSAATEAACLVLSVDGTVRASPAEKPPPMQPPKRF